MGHWFTEAVLEISLLYLSKTARKSSENTERLGIFYKFIFWRCRFMLIGLKLICIMILATSESRREFLFTYKRRFIFGFSSKYRVKNKKTWICW